MRFVSLSLGLLVFGLSSLVSADPNPLPLPPPVQADTLSKTTSPARDVKAPELPELTGTNFYDKIAKGYWFVKHYSPTCGHCIAVAPTWKTLHEFYSTSTLDSTALPPPGAEFKSQSASPSFTENYDFHFANLNCNAYGDICVEEKLNIHGYPTFNLYKDGKLVDQFKKTTRDLSSLSEFVETYLEEIKPGSRPKTITLPKVPDASEEETPQKEEKEGEVGKTEAQETEADATEEKATKVQSPRPSPPKQTANLLGESMNLDAEAFLRLVTTTRDPWFIKFYAPWCGHCQAMAPAWSELGREMKGSLNIGEVNCEVEKRLCRDVNLRGYPTILFFQGGERVEYDGLRGLGDLVAYARKAVNSGVNEVDLVEFEEMEKAGMEVAFIYFYDQATTSEDFAALERITLPLIGHAPLLKTSSDLMAKRFRVTTWPRLIVVRDGKPSYYLALSPKDMRDTNKVLDWMKSVWLPIVPELSAANSHEIMHGKTVVLGILSRNRPNDFATAKAELKKAAMEFMDQRQMEEKNEKQELRDRKQLRIEEAEDRDDERALRAAKNMRINVEKKKEVGFAWVDGVFWERWVRSTYGVNVNEVGERIIINDEDNKRYWDITLDGAPIRPSRSAILDTLKAVIADPPKIQSKSSTNRLYSVFYRLRSGFGHHPVLSTFGAIVLIVVAAVYGKGLMRRRAGGFFKLEGKEGLLGGNTGTKAD
ncbi:uncharacterized protein H6S33_006909 [Morchella sextelata]|uniref:uncharacterized protein n=1 Tax=Morchella sextelata TaxID=1174677 RepID=UPI001D045F9E|nr:uncharacterized protein H6S33_006909 [Morchella sextelata]KAH0604532.1 hypothetical protein H6S33_006909 [Morchella sextelata]